VATTGSDNNNGLTSGTPFLTIQKAIDTACALDLSVYAVTIQVGAGTYTAGNILKSYLGTGPITILCDATTPTNVVISVTSTSCFTGSGVLGKWVINGFKVTAATSGNGFNFDSTVCALYNINYGSVPFYHINADRLSNIQTYNAQTISGPAQIHWLVSHDSTMDVRQGVYSFTTNPTNFTQFANVSLAASLQCNGLTFTNASYVTGARYYVDRNGVIDTAGGGANYLPGSTAGSTATGGTYS